MGEVGSRRPVHVDVGTDEGEFDDGNEKPLELMMVDPGAFILGVGTFLVAVLALVFVAKVSAILRDGDVGTPIAWRAFKWRLAYLITAAFVFIWLVTGDTMAS